ncbi:MAG: thiamine diphosphokinase [Elusimicrobiota bacterium]
MPRTALLILNGELREPRRVRAAAAASDLLICADGGARHARTLGLVPDFIVGDMDSLARPLPRLWTRTVHLRDDDPERSDLDKALRLARSLGAVRVLIAGALGGDLDHELVNFAVFEARARGLDLSLIDGGTAVLLGPGRHLLPLKSGARFSLLAAPRARLSVTGARFAVRDETLARGSRGLGNRARGKVSIRVRSGLVWAFWGL